MADWERIEAHLARASYGDQLERIMPVLRRIDEVRAQKNALVLAHYYQLPPIQAIADKTGDSLALAQYAKKVSAERPDVRLIVSSTVEFMAEMIKMLSPDRKVVIPGLGASCSIAEGMSPGVVRRIRDAYPDAAIVGYINSRAATMAEYDATCTSANAREVVQAIPGDPVIMVPDYFLARNTLKDLSDGRNYLAYEKTVGGRIILHDTNRDRRYAIPTDVLPQREAGTCIVHEQFTPEDVDHYRKAERVDLVLAHPEVNPDVAARSDFVGGTQRMIEYVRGTKARRLMVVSECDLTAPLMAAYPERDFVTPCKICPYMKRNTLEGVLSSLEHEIWEVKVPEEIAVRARAAIERMFSLTARTA